MCVCGGGEGWGELGGAWGGASWRRGLWVERQGREGRRKGWEWVLLSGVKA